MPVTAKLSQKFYEKFGDEITNELVEWFNAVDATYRADLRELNELNFSRPTNDPVISAGVMIANIAWNIMYAKWGTVAP